MLTVGARPKRPAKRHAAVLTHTICGGKVGIDRQGRSSGEHIARGVWAVGPGHSGVRCLRVEDDKKLIPVPVWVRKPPFMALGWDTYHVLGGTDGPVSLDGHIALDGDDLGSETGARGSVLRHHAA